MVICYEEQTQVNRNRFPHKSKLGLIVFLAIFIEVLGCSPLLNPAYGQTIYFSSNFETGDLSEWTANGRGSIYYAPPVQITTEVAHSGKYSARCHLANPSVQNMAKLLRWRIDRKNAFYSAWYYFDEKYHVNKWGNIMQWMTDPYGIPDSDSIRPTFFVEAFTVNNIRQLRLNHWAVEMGFLPPDPKHPQQVSPGSGKYVQSNPIPIPNNTWIHIEAYYQTHKSNGKVIVWQNGVEVFNVSGVNTQDSVKPSEFVLFGVGNYMSKSESINQLLYVDDIMVTDYQVSATGGHSSTKFENSSMISKNHKDCKF